MGASIRDLTDMAFLSVVVHDLDIVRIDQVAGRGRTRGRGAGDLRRAVLHSSARDVQLV
jgi:hypothetical protein